MNGEFNQSFRKYLYSLMFIIFGTYMAIRMSLWGVEEVRANHVASSLSLFTFAAFGFLLGLVGIFIFKFNRKAYLKIDGGKIDARFGWGKEVHAELRELTNAEKNGRNLKLCTKDGIVWIYNLDNAKELCQYILARISKHYKPVDVEEAKLEYKITRKSYVKYLIATIAFGALLFVNIILETLLTKGKDLSEFSKFDTLTFAIFLVAETVIAVITFFFARKCGKKLEASNTLNMQILSSYAYEYRKNNLENYPDIAEIKYFNRYVYRIVLFALSEFQYSYTIERFDVVTLSWKLCYESDTKFEALSDLQKEIKTCFENEIFDE